MEMVIDESPWRLPPSAPYVLPDDEPFIREFNARLRPNHDYFVDTSRFLPEPFLGARDAPVVLLSNNPGFGGEESDRHHPDFAATMRRNLLHEPSEHPFPFLAPDFAGKWWKSKLKELIALFGQQVVARSILNVVYFPYLSRRYGHQRLRLPSQDYSFRLVANAVNHGATIVHMRPGNADWWSRAVPELRKHDRLFSVRNPQTPAISRRNCPGFDAVVQAIMAANRVPSTNNGPKLVQ